MSEERAVAYNCLYNQCNLCKDIQIGENVVLGINPGTILIGQVVGISQDCQTITLIGTNFAVAGILVFPPLGLLTFPITVCCQNIQAISKITISV